MLPVPLHTDMCRSVILIAALCHSFLISPTLLCLSPLCSSRATLRLSVFLLWYLGSVPLYNTKICPGNTEELIIDAKTMDPHVRGRYTLQLILLHTLTHHIRYINYGTKKGTALSKLL